MSKSVLSPEKFGEKLYFLFPKMYRDKDEEVEFALKRYMNTLGEGGFRYIIEDTNRLLTLYDAGRVDSDILPYLFKSFGLEIFNGIPELYLRNLLPVLGDIYERKGTKDVIEYLTTVIANNVTTSVEITGVETDNTQCVVTLELDYTATDEDFPYKEQLVRIIRKFLPFWCGLSVVYAFIFIDSTRLYGTDINFSDYVRDNREENSGVSLYDVINNVIGLKDTDRGILINENEYATDSAIFGEALFGSAVFGNNNGSAIFGEALFGSAVFGNNKPSVVEVDDYYDTFNSDNEDRGTFSINEYFVENINYV